MLPSIRSGDIVVGWRGVIRPGSVVIARARGREVIKRVYSIEGDNVDVRGDNPENSTDSREFGLLKISDILGVIMIHFATSRPAPKLHKPYGAILGWIAATILIVLSLLQLFRIDTFVPEMTHALPGSYNFAAILTALVLVMQVFALPFLLRMRLSLFASVLSGIFSVFAPLFWVLVAVWNFGAITTVPQFGEYFIGVSTGWLLAINVLWLIFAYTALWALGFDRAYSPAFKRFVTAPDTSKKKRKS